jgi:Na+-driven multidrug efflux pump
MLVIIGIAQSLSIFTASNSGADKTDRIKEGYRIGMLISTFFLIFITALNFIIPNYLIGAFVDISEYPKAYQFAKNYLQFSLLAYLFYGWKIINESVLRGFLMMKEYLLSNLSDLVVKVVLTYLLVIPFSLSGFWMGNMLGKVVAFIISMLVIKQKHLINRKQKHIKFT